MQYIDEYYIENDNTYVNISFVNSASNGGKTIELNYNATKTSQVLDDCSKYYATIVKFDIPLNSLPLVIAEIIPMQSNPNLMPMQIGIRNGGVNYLQNVIYVSQANNLPAPDQSTSPVQVITPYYFMYSYDQLITMINTALSVAFVAAGLNTPGTGIANIVPYFRYDSVTGLFSLIVNNSFNSPTGPQVIMNYFGFKYLDKFDMAVVPPFTPTNRIYSFVVNGLVNDSFAYNYYGITPPATIAPPFTASAPPVFPVIPQPYFYRITQNSVSVSTWNPVRKILFLTTMPIKFEVVPGSNNTSNANGVYSSLNVLTDFTPQIQNPADSSSVAYYAPGGYGNYRLTDMTTNQSLYKVDIRVVWQDVSNNIYNVTIDEFSQANIKIGFIRKSLYKHK
jgi:hypothetical protein